MEISKYQIEVCTELRCLVLTSFPQYYIIQLAHFNFIKSSFVSHKIWCTDLPVLTIVSSFCEYVQLTE